jgi:hypothetical protein
VEVTVKTRAEAHKIAREYLQEERVLSDNAIDHYIVNQLLDKLGFPHRDPPSEEF